MSLINVIETSRPPREITLGFHELTDWIVMKMRHIS